MKFQVLSGFLRPPKLAALSAAVLIMAAVLLVIVSMQGRALFSHIEDADWQLGADEDIRARVTFDRASYLPGELVHYRLQVTWQPARATPDFGSLERNLAFHPLDHVGRRVETRNLGDGVREYFADVTLQAVEVNTTESYELGTATVFYTRPGDESGTVHAFRTNPPRVHIGEYYPGNVAGIGLRPTKTRIDDAQTLRRVVMVTCGSLLLVILVAVIWQYGRRRTFAELSPAEQLWREIAVLRCVNRPDRERLGEYEQIAARVFELRAGITPAEFWTGTGLGDWRTNIDTVRHLAASAYRPDDPAAEDVETLGKLLDDLLRPVVEEERLQHEMHNRFVERIGRQPRVLAACAALVLSVVTAFILAVQPSLWVSGDIRSYNATVAMLDEAADVQGAIDAFVALADATGDPRVSSASLYNVGTLLVDPRLSRLSREQYRNFLNAVFLSDISLDRLLHDIEIDTEFELVTLLTELTRQYVKAEQMLETAVRTDPADPDTRRNLEVLGKTRRAIAHSLARLASLGDDTAGTQQLLSQTVIDLRLLMEAELPDDYARLDEGKDDRDYYIMEKF